MPSAISNRKKTFIDRPGTSTDSFIPLRQTTRDGGRPTTPEIINYPPLIKELFEKEQNIRSRSNQGSPSKLEEMIYKSKE